MPHLRINLNNKPLLLLIALLNSWDLLAQKIIFDRDFSPSEGLVSQYEFPYREEICLNGLWNFQAVLVPSDWKRGTGIAPLLTKPINDKWEKVKIKIPSAINVNDWGNGYKTGKNTERPYAPSTIYYPSYPENWVHARMGWLRKTFSIPQKWYDKRLIIHFEGVAGDCAVFINGKQVCHNFDTFLPFEADITDMVNLSQENEILVGVRHSRLFDVSHPVYTKFGATYPPGSNMDNLLGIWNDVFLWAVPETRITDIFVQPYLDTNTLIVDVEVSNHADKTVEVNIEGTIKEWINLAGEGILEAPEISWKLGETALRIQSKKSKIAPGETKKIRITQKVNGELNEWSPDTPNLYTLLLNVNDKNTTYDCKTIRFGWRQFTIEGDHFALNGKKIQCFGDIQHPFSAYICSRRFTYAWYQMIKDFGGNCVRPHAQPWPRVYYELADEMGLMVLDETALFGSSIRLNFEEELTWQRSEEHLERLIKRDRNHPSVIGWSAGNELFAIALLNKPPKEVSERWDDKMVDLTLSALQHDSTRAFITLNGDRDMEGRLPVWSKHFGHGLRIEDLPKDAGKPLIVGESGATYYGRPIQLYPFIGEKAFESYKGRSEALAIDVYQNAVYMARPYLSYFSPSEVCWFGIEHMNLGYHDFSRLPDSTDGIFAGKTYEEGKPGYQYERIPPYVTTFNPGLDPSLPLYKPLPMFEALQSALSGKKPQPSPWDSYTENVLPEIADFSPVKYDHIAFIGKKDSKLANHILRSGIQLNDLSPKTNFVFIDAENTTSEELKKAEKRLKKIQKNGGVIMAMGIGNPFSSDFINWLPAKIEQTERYATALESSKENEWGKHFQLPDIYFAEMDGDKRIQKSGLKGELVDNGSIVFTASGTDWSLFNNVQENQKCAQVVLYETIHKPEGVAVIDYPLDKARLCISVLDYTLYTNETKKFWQTFYSVLGVDLSHQRQGNGKDEKKVHNLLMDGPIN